jgi:oxygen-independent coproporphyrinogen-3 oxidase
MDALLQQLHFELKHFKVEKNSIETLFIGGGTPSTVAPELYSSLFELLHPYLQKDAEITTEANPNSATKEWLYGMRELGVNRISFGVQSFDAKKLKLLNRAHTPQMAYDAINNAADVGFNNLSLDLIYATQGDTKELLQNDLTQAFSLPINHLSAYALTIEENTPFAKTPQMAAEQLELTEWLFNSIEQRGFKQYEISNFGSYRSRHNLGYWEYKEYIGAGSGAVGKRADKRFYPNPEIEAYIKAPLTMHIEELSEEDMRLEKIFLGFRSCVGVSKDILTDSEKIKADILQKEKKLHYKEGVFYNPNYLLADEIALFLTS